MPKTDEAKQFLSEHWLVALPRLQRLCLGRRYRGVAWRLVRLDRKATQTWIHSGLDRGKALVGFLDRARESILDSEKKGFT